MEDNLKKTSGGFLLTRPSKDTRLFFSTRISPRAP